MLVTASAVGRQRVADKQAVHTRSDAGAVFCHQHTSCVQVSLPMLAPLLLGTGMMFRSIKANASIIFPRIGLLVVLLWVSRLNVIPPASQRLIRMLVHKEL